ncbi:MAG: FkbM family methyltransferase [Pirellulales bacterium]|nr:FkbM family methyltransferase [Pirellulales bacterium]
MRLSDLFSLRRYRRCREIFRSPLAAHLQLAFSRPRPLTLALSDGGSLHLPNVRKCRETLRWLLEESRDGRMRSIGGGLFEVEHGDSRVVLPDSDESSGAFRDVYLHDCYRVDELQRPLDTVVDLGGNVGLFSSRIAPFAKKVVCVEPIQGNMKIARENVRRTHCAEKVTFHQLAVAGQSGCTEKIYLSKGSRGGNSIDRKHASRWGDNGCKEVVTISLADLFRREAIERCSFLKCDVEGAEFEIFAAAPRDILMRIDKIAMEVHLTTSEWGVEAFHRLRDTLDDAGFSVSHESIYDSNDQLKRLFMLWAFRKEASGTGGVAA